MPPSWTGTTDPNVAFDTQGRVYQTMLPFNSYFDAARLHPDGEIDISDSDDLGRHWAKANGGVPPEPPNNASALQLGHVQDKRWVAVNHIVGNESQDHVYAASAVFNGQLIKLRMTVSRDRGQTFDKAITISAPSDVGPGGLRGQPVHRLGDTRTVYRLLPSGWRPPAAAALPLHQALSCTTTHRRHGVMRSRSGRVARVLSHPGHPTRCVKD